MTRNRILVLGRGNIDKTSIVNSIISESKRNVKGSPTESSALIPWTIDTKYYTADVSFWIDDTTADGDKEAIAMYMDEENGIGNAVDAILFVFEKSRKDTFGDIVHFLPFVEEYEPAITLAIGAGGKSTEKDAEYFDEWCIENGFEYVDLDTVAEADQDQGLEEQVGMGRVLEALQSNMWQGLKRHETEQTVDAALQTERDESEKDEKLEEALASLEITKSNEHDEDDLYSLIVGGTSDKDLDVMPTSQEVQGLHQQLFGDWGEDEQRSFGHDNVEKAFQIIKNMKEQGKDMPIEQRKKMAAMIALSFGMQM